MKYEIKSPISCKAYVCWKISCDKNCILKKIKFFSLIKVILPFFLKCKQFLFLLAYFFSEIIILILFLFNILHPFYLIFLFNKRIEIVQNTGYITGSFCYILGYHLFINLSLVSVCQHETDQTCGKDSSLIFSKKIY